jgi:hypothetical protein
MKSDHGFSMFRVLARVGLALAMVFVCHYAQAMCVRPVGDPNDPDPAKSEVKYAVATSEAVFIGYVTAMEYVPAHTELGHGEMLVIRMAARTWWKGDRSEVVTLNSSNHRYPDGAISWEVHDYSYEVGRTYLVYANADHDGLYASACTRTKPVDKAADDIAILDTLTDGSHDRSGRP